MTATYFGEITGLNSRAVWYSDEEDEEDVETLEDQTKGPGSIQTAQNAMKIKLNFVRLQQLNISATNCIIGQASSAQFKNMKQDQTSQVITMGYFDDFGRVMVVAHPQTEEITLWLLFDTANPLIRGHNIGYVVGDLCEYLYDEFHLDSSCPVTILSQQFSNTDQLEYLTNFTVNLTNKLPFNGKPMKPPTLIRNQLEASLFEQLTLIKKSAVVVCLPNPKNFWFDKTKDWPTAADKIIDLRLTDDNLEKTLIFT